MIEPFLVFRLGASYFAIEAVSVLEIAPMPEIIKLEGVPRYLAGVVTLHGRVVPVVDIQQRFGYAPQKYRLEDGIVFLERQGKAIGVVVNDAEALHNFDPAEFVSLSGSGLEGQEAGHQAKSHFVRGVATWGGQSGDCKMIMRLDVESIFDLSGDFADRGAEEAAVSLESLRCPFGESSEEMGILRERSLRLAYEETIDEGSDSSPVAVVRIEEEFFGISLDTVKEFAVLRNVAPIPCCPDHVVGQINLRGDLITIADVGRPLGLNASSQGADRSVVVINDPTLAVGILVDELLGILEPHSQGLGFVVQTAGVTAPGYRLGSVTDGNRNISLIDLPKLMRQEGLVVNETLS